MLEKTYNPAEIEAKHDRSWEEGGWFRPSADPDARPYCIVIPPPNVTGSLHIGHALNNTIQDTLIRFHRMQGRAVLWQPGSDHAGIATQMVVERELAKEGRTRGDLGREAFVGRVWDWKEHSGGLISKQLHRLGASADWSRDRFTMDDGLSAAVRKVFVDLYRDGLIYKDKRLVNWDCKLHTAVSDLEVDQKEIEGRLWYIRYPIEGEEGRFITVATTRPETMLGDTGVAVHPDDPRYRDLLGKHAVLPLVGRRLPIVADEYSDPEKGSGAVKITPAHDFNDFEVGRRHGLEPLNILEPDGTLNEAVPEPYRGVDRFVARERVLADLEAQGLIEKIEPIRHTVPYSQRSETPIEPFLSDQWYADAKALAAPAIAAVEQGRTRFVPPQWANIYFEWMRNIQPWCISRQLWWGHQIPAWYGSDGEIFVEETENLALAAAERHYGSRVMLTRDEDVLDTWFSSALWPFSTLGWPEETPELKRFYPTNVLVTGFDIIFFWVARMMMFGLHFMEREPFDTVYIHALVRDAKGQKMSKSKGNVIDPLDLVQDYGADALRFTLAAMAAQGRDIKMAPGRVEGYRNFGTKLWNAARFCEMSGVVRDPDFDPVATRLTLNRWIAGELVRTRDAVTAGIEEHRYNDAAAALYSFTWHVFCDWYLELIKPILAGDDEAAAETRDAAGWVLDQILLLLHPFMPFLTEELWQRTDEAGHPRETALILAPWPVYEGLGDKAAEAEINWVIELVSSVRSVRSEMNVPGAARIPCVIAGATPETRRRADRWQAEITRLARLESLSFVDTVPEGAAQIVLGESTVALPLAGIIDFAAERARLEKELDKAAKDIAAIDARLGNKGFLAKAPEDVVEEARDRRTDLEARKGRIAEALTRL